MKKVINKIVPIMMLIFAASCSDSFLEVEPLVNKQEANAYKNEDDAFLAVVGVYDALAVQPWNFVPLQSDIFSDDLFTGGEPGGGMGQWQEQEQSLITGENAAALALWDKSFAGIYRANLYFEKEGEILWSDEAKRKRLIAEVTTLRGYFYWDLARHFGWVPIISEPLENPEDFLSIEQQSPEAVYQFIARDLLTAIPDLPLTVNGSEKGRITKDVARVLIARIYMHYEGFVKPVLGVSSDWSDGQTVITKNYVQSMIDEIITSNRYQLLDDYADVFDWANENNEESIFEWQYSPKAISGDWGGWGVDGNFSSVFFGPRSPEGDPEVAAGWSFGIPTWSLYNEFEEGDPRRDVTLYNADEKLSSYQKGFQNTGYFLYKYMPRAAFRPPLGTADLNWGINYKDMRLAEVYLIGAELWLNDDPGKALDYLNEVRTRAMGDDAALESITLDDIYHERRVELAGEGHRKWDLLRRGLDYAKEKIDASWVVPPSANLVDFQGRKFETSTYGMLPIPASEIRLMNPGVLEQHVPAFQ